MWGVINKTKCSVWILPVVLSSIACLLQTKKTVHLCPSLSGVITHFFDSDTWLIDLMSAYNSFANTFFSVKTSVWATWHFYLLPKFPTLADHVLYIYLYTAIYMIVTRLLCYFLTISNNNSSSSPVFVPILPLPINVMNVAGLLNKTQKFPLTLCLLIF